MNRRTITAVVGVMAVAVTLSGCNRSNANDGGGTTAKQPYVALISKGFRHQFWQSVKAGAEQAGKELNVKVTFEGAQEEGNVEQQIQLLQTTLDKHPDAVGFAAIDSQAAGPLMQQAKNDHIPVIAFDSGVDSDVPVCTASTDNLAAAAEAAKHMADLIGHDGKIAMVVHDQTSVTGVQRRDGFVNYLKKNEPKITVVDIQYSGDPLKATDLAKAMIAAQPGPQGYVRFQRGCGHRRRARGAGARHHGQAEGRRLRLRQGPDRRHQERPHGRRDHAEPGRHRLRDGEGGRGGDQGPDAWPRPSTPGSTGTTRRTSTTRRSPGTCTSRHAQGSGGCVRATTWLYKGQLQVKITSQYEPCSSPPAQGWPSPRTRADRQCRGLPEAMVRA